MALFTIVGGFLTIGLGAATITTGVSGLFATVSAFALNTIVGIGLNLAVQAAAGQQTPGFSVQGRLQAGGDVSRSIMLGYSSTAGSLVYANTWGRTAKAKNAYLTQVICVSDWRVGGLADVWVNGAKCTLLTGEADPDKGIPVLQYRAKGIDYLWVKFYDGTQTEADPFLVNTVSTAERPYSDKRVGYGCAYAITTARVNGNLWTGFPSFKFVLNGAPLYDVSKDTTAGGDGAHRYDDPATWGGDGDHFPAVQLYNLTRGFYRAGTWFYGMQQVTAARLPAVPWIAAIAKCRTTITVGGVPESTYRTGGELPVNAELGNAVKAILTGCSGRLSEIAGSYDLQLGAPGAPTFSFGDGDILSTEPQRFTPFFGLAETVTGITGKYPSPVDGWNAKACPPIYRSDLEAKAGNRRLLADVPFDLVPYPAQAQRLLRAAIEESQRERRHTIVLPPKYWKYAVPGATCEWTVSERNGYVTKLFRVDGAVDRANLDVMVDITEVDPADYDPGEFVPPSEPPTGPIVVPPQALPTFNAEGYAIPDADGVPRRPAIRITFAADLDDVRAVQVQVRLSGETEVIYNYDIPYGDVGDDDTTRQVVLNGTFVPNEDYEVSGTLAPKSEREVTPSGWIPVTTPDIRLGDDDLSDDLNDFFDWLDDSVLTDIPAQIAAEAALRNAAIQAEAALRIADAASLADRFRWTQDSLDDVAVVIAEQDFRNWADKQQLRREIKVAKDDVTAGYLEAITVAIDDNSAIAIKLETLTAQVEDAAAAVSTETAARVTGDEALATQITLLSAGSGDQFDWVKLWFFDSGVEGFTGNGAPVAAGGFIRPANHATDPYIESPTGIGAAGTSYKQVRLRIRKTGTPTWEGYLWWRGPSDVTWDAARRVSFSEPSYSGVYGNVTINPEWTVDIDRIRIDLSSDQDASNYFEIDWIGVGRPSPGASLAALLAEQVARADGDSALAALITTLTASVNDLDGEVAGQGTILSTMQVTVETLEGDLTAVEALVDTIVNVTLPGKASATALSALEAEVAELGGGGAVATGRIISSIRTEMQYLGELIGDGMFADELGNAQARKLVADAYQILDTSIKQVDGKVDIAANAITAVQATLGNKADAYGVSVISVRVTETETAITSLSTAMTGVTAALGTKADASAVTTLTARVTAVEGDVESIADLLTEIDAEVDGFSASGKFRITTEATPVGASARIGISVAATGGGATATAAIFLDAIAGGQSRVIVNSDRFYVTNTAGTVVSTPFAIVGGVVQMTVADIGTVTAGVMKSADNKFVIDLNNKFISISD